MASPSNYISLSELTQFIQETILSANLNKIWVVCEIAELNETRVGHCYLDLVEKETSGKGLNAKVRATIWASTYRMLKPFFEAATNRKLSSGLRVLLQCSVNYHPVYGISLNVSDIEPAFTIGEIEQNRRETIEKLVAEGVFNMNKELEIPQPPKRVAIISSKTAAGYQDFTNQIDNNPQGYKIEYKLFEATVQGNQAEESIVGALNSIYKQFECWDVVVIIRGGGSQTDLSCFDNYSVASNIAQFPIPIITGIGHERDMTIADMVSNNRQKTPTAAAEFIISQFALAEARLNESVSEILGSVEELVSSKKMDLQLLEQKIIPKLFLRISEKNVYLIQLRMKLAQQVKLVLVNNYNVLKTKGQMTTSKFIRILEAAKHKEETLASLIKKVPIGYIGAETKRIEKLFLKSQYLDPEILLSKGYSITLKDGKRLKNLNQLSKGDDIVTVVYQGTINSKVYLIDKKE
jgi:exodeoxyribonuclease VII large subunit